MKSCFPFFGNKPTATSGRAAAGTAAPAVTAAAAGTAAAVGALAPEGDSQLIDHVLSQLRFTPGTRDDIQRAVKTSLRSFLARVPRARLLACISADQTIETGALIRLVLEQRVKQASRWTTKTGRLIRLVLEQRVTQASRRTTLPPLDLRGLDLSRLDLREADLSGADLKGANLSVAKLVGANLSRANLSGAKLDMSSLREANLSEANLSGASVWMAILSGANLAGSNLEKTDLSWSDLSGVKLEAANLDGAKLSKVKWGKVSIGTMMAVMAMESQDEEAIHWSGACLNASQEVALDGHEQLSIKCKNSINRTLDEMLYGEGKEKTDEVVYNIMKVLIALKNTLASDRRVAKAGAMLSHIVERFPFTQLLVKVMDNTVSPADSRAAMQPALDEIERIASERGFKTEVFVYQMGKSLIACKNSSTDAQVAAKARDALGYIEERFPQVATFIHLLDPQRPEVMAASILELLGDDPSPPIPPSVSPSGPEG